MIKMIMKIMEIIMKLMKTSSRPNDELFMMIKAFLVV